MEEIEKDDNSSNIVTKLNEAENEIEKSVEEDSKMGNATLSENV